MKGKRTFKRLLVVGFAVAALGASVAQAATRPDDRAGTRGVGAQQPTDVVSRYLSRSVPTAVRPDDRAGQLGIGDSSDTVGRYPIRHLAPTAVRPDDRAGPLGVGTDNAGVVTPASHTSGSWWGPAEVSAAAFLGALAIALIGFALVRQKRSASAALQS